MASHREPDHWIRRLQHEFENQNHRLTYERGNLYRNFSAAPCDLRGSNASYVRHRTSIRLNNNSFDVEVTVDQDSIRSIHLANLSESTSAMFPLVEPVLDSLASQIYSTQSLENLEYSSDQKYTALMLIHAVDKAVAKAETAG